MFKPFETNTWMIYRRCIEIEEINLNFPTVKPLPKACVNMSQCLVPPEPFLLINNCFPNPFETNPVILIFLSISYTYKCLYSCKSQKYKISLNGVIIFMFGKQPQICGYATYILSNPIISQYIMTKWFLTSHLCNLYIP